MQRIYFLGMELDSANQTACLTREMTCAQYFSKLDASQGFWKLKLHEDSTKYCMFNTPFGRYSFLRLPFGIISASEIFHRAMEHVIEGLVCVRAYVEDIVVWGSSVQEHNQRLIQLLHRIHKHGLKLNRAKCLFGVTEITFLGDELSGRGVEPDKSKIQAILDMPSPVDKKDVLRIMGMVNFIGKFISNLSAKTVSLRELLNHKVEFKWTNKHEQEWKMLKSTLTTETSSHLLWFFKKYQNLHWCTKEWIGCSLTPSRCWKLETHSLCLQDYDTIWMQICSDRKRMPQTCFWIWQISRLCLWLTIIHCRNGP